MDADDVEVVEGRELDDPENRSQEKRDRFVNADEITASVYVWGALGLSTLILVGAVYLPGISLALSTAPIGPDGWLVVLGMSLLPLVVGQGEREFRRRFGTPNFGTMLENTLPDRVL